MFMNGASNQQINNIGWDIINAKPNVELTWSYSNYPFHSIKKWIPMLGFTDMSLEPMWESTWHLLLWLFGMYTHLLKIFLSWGTFKQCKVHPKWTYNYDINNYFQCLRLLGVSRLMIGGASSWLTLFKIFFMTPNPIYLIYVLGITSPHHYSFQ